jgi:hypothetical protein
MCYFEQEGQERAHQKQRFPLLLQMRIIVRHQSEQPVDIDAQRERDEVRTGRHSESPAGCGEQQKGHVVLGPVEEVGQADEGDGEEGGLN